MGGLKVPTDAQVDKELADGAALGARLLASCEPAFPQALAALDPPPPLIWARGRIARGTNDLIRQGAALCEGAEDVLRAIEGLRGFREPDRDLFAGAGPLDPDDALRERVAALLSPTPLSRDEIVRATDAPAPLVFAALVELSLAGRCELLPGGMVSTA
ncbi:MAG: dprA protein [Phenylobacterium sp.]|jgi:predicted Rossmann fold nucleotide-binding protein DprA/Smf involved in DNA uptake|nr:dprA protein [Phenylobacterium sp.]